VKTRVYIDRIVLESLPRRGQSRDGMAARLTREVAQRLHAHPMKPGQADVVATRVAQAVHEGVAR